MMFFVGGAYLVAENDSFKVAIYGSHGIKEYIYKKKGKFEFIFPNSGFILAIPRLYLTILIRKINSSFSLLPSARNHILHLWLFFLKIDKL